MSSRTFRYIFACLLFIGVSFCCSTPLWAETSPGGAAKSLPGMLGRFRARGPVSSAVTLPFENFSLEDFGTVSAAQRTYVSADGRAFSVTIIRTELDSGAYALLTAYGRGNEDMHLRTIGAAHIINSAGLAFFTGPAFVIVRPLDKNNSNENQITALATQLASTLPADDNDIPVLTKHLPNWKPEQRVYYAVTGKGLIEGLPDQPITKEIDFEGGAEAVTSYYGATRLVIVEFNTPQLAGDNDRRITEKIQELHSQNQRVPTAYRRVGNYSIFVFDAPSEQAANQLIDQVKYQQVVQWLGTNPYLYEQATREFTETTLGVFVAVVKASGLALLTCFAVGGFFGTLLFSYRRARRRNQEAFSDAGGILRLNLDEMTSQPNASRLLRPGH